MKRIFILYAFIFSISTTIQAQQLVEISGTITDSLNIPLNQKALVMVVNKDSLNNIASGEYNTNFQLSYIARPDKEYMLYIFIPGYKDRYIEITDRVGDLGKIALFELSQKLKEVVVKANALQHEVYFGDDIYKISGSILANEYSLYTMLSRIPGVFVNRENVEITGLGAPVFTINGQRPRPGELDMITPEEIDKVMVIRSPSAKYGNNVKGVIDIRMKKKLRDYFSARVSEEMELGDYHLQNKSTLQVNHKDGKWTNYLGYTYNFGKDRCDLYNQMEVTVENDILKDISNEIENSRNTGHHLIVSPKYQINENSYADIQYNLGFNNNKAKIFSTGTRYNSLDNLQEIFNNESHRKSDNPTHQVTARYYTEWKNHSTLEANVSYAKLKTISSQTINEQIEEINQVTLMESNINNNVYTASLDYDLPPIASKFLMSIGGGYTLIQNDAKTFYNEKTDDEYSTYTDIEDHMGNLYADFKYANRKLVIGVGIRGEYNHRTDSYNEENNFHSLDFSPRIRFSYKLSASTTLSLNYNFSTKRPSMSQLDPNPIYINKYMYVAGNPNLKFAKGNSLNLGIRLPYNISLNVNYTYTKDDIFRAIMSDKKKPHIVTYTYANIKNSQELISTLSFWKTWSWYNLILNGSYSHSFTKAPYLNEEINYIKPYFVIHLQNTFMFNCGLSGSVLFHYYSKNEQFPTITDSKFNIGADLTYKYKQWHFSAYCNNIIYKRIAPTTQKYLNIYRYQEADLHTRYIGLRISYKFSRFQDLFKKNTTSDEAIQRAN